MYMKFGRLFYAKKFNTSKQKSLERECLEEKCSNGEIHEVYENDRTPQFGQNSFKAAKEFIESKKTLEKQCVEFLHVEDNLHKVDGMYHMVHGSELLLLMA